MRKHRPVRELLVAATLFTLNAVGITYILGAPQSVGLPIVVYENDPADGCDDGIDNDVPPDGLVDCGDPDCFGVEPCVAPAPALGPAGLVVGAGLLLLIGGAALKVRRREE